MSYRAGSYGLESLGIASGPPRITCDGDGCDNRITLDGLPPEWFLAGKAKRGWRVTGAAANRRDYCPQHRPPQEGR